MAELPHDQPEFQQKLPMLYVRKLSRLSFQPIGELREALLGLYGEKVRSRMGQSALFLYSQPQIEHFRPRSIEYRASEQRDSILNKRLKLGMAATKQFELAKWVGLARDEQQARTGLALNVLLDVETQMVLHEGVNEGLDQTLFGRRAIQAILWVPERDLVATEEEWHDAAARIKQAVWGGDDLASASTKFRPPAENAAKMAQLEWKTRLVDGQHRGVAQT